MLKLLIAVYSMLTDNTMSIQDFLSQCDDATLDYIDENVLPHLIKIDRLYKLQSGCSELRQEIEAINEKN